MLRNIPAPSSNTAVLSEIDSTPFTDVLLVLVTRSGGIFVNGESASAMPLDPLLPRIHAQSPRAAVTLYADAKAPYGAIVRVPDAAKACGVPDVSFATE